MLELYGYHDNHEIGDIVPVDNQEYVDFFITNGIAELIVVEAKHHIQDDEDFVKYGVEKDEIITVYDDIPIVLETRKAKWKY